MIDRKLHPHVLTRFTLSTVYQFSVMLMLLGLFPILFTVTKPWRIQLADNLEDLPNISLQLLSLAASLELMDLLHLEMLHGTYVLHQLQLGAT